MEYSEIELNRSYVKKGNGLSEGIVVTAKDKSGVIYVSRDGKDAGLMTLKEFEEYLPIGNPLGNKSKVLDHHSEIDLDSLISRRSENKKRMLAAEVSDMVNEFANNHLDVLCPAYRRIKKLMGEPVDMLREPVIGSEFIQRMNFGIPEDKEHKNPDRVDCIDPRNTIFEDLITNPSVTFMEDTPTINGRALTFEEYTMYVNEPDEYENYKKNLEDKEKSK